MLFAFCVLLAEKQLVNADQITSNQRRTVSPDEASRFDAAKLVDTYADMLHRPWLWSIEAEVEVVWPAIKNSKDPKIDPLLISLARKVMEEEGAMGMRLDHFGPKRPGTNSENLLELMGKRGTPRLIDFIASLTSNKHPIIRYHIVGALGADVLSDPQHEGLRAKIAPLLEDKHPEVAWATAKGISRCFVEKKAVISHVFARALISAYEKTQPGVKASYGEDVRETISGALQAYHAHLKTSRESASPQERDQIDSVIQIIKQSQWGKEKHD